MPKDKPYRWKIPASDTETTLVKYVDRGTSESESRRESNSSEGGISNIKCSLLSGSIANYSERTGSTTTDSIEPCPPPRTRSLTSVTADRNNNAFNHNRPLPSIPTSSRQQHQRRTTSSSSHSASEHSRSDDVQQCLKRRHLALITMASLAIGIISFGLSAVCLICKIGPAFDEYSFDDGDSEVCVPCDSLNITDTERRQFETRVDKIEECCARDSGQMSALFEMLRNRQKKIITASKKPTAPTNKKPHIRLISAHKYLDKWNNKGPRNCSNLFCHTKLTVNSTYREHARHVNAKTTGLEIEYSGWYFVYANVHFRQEDGMPCNKLANKTFQLFVVKKFFQGSRQCNITLAESEHTCCPDCEDDSHSSFTGGVFQLMANDHIFVGYSGSASIVYNGTVSYLGLVMLSGLESPVRHGQNVACSTD